MKDKEIIAAYRIEDCTRCKNECAVTCPVYRHYGTCHPQELAHLFLAGGEKAAHAHHLIWMCVTCKACTAACPFKVEFADFVRELRVGRTDYQPVFGGVIHSYQVSQAGFSDAGKAAVEANAGGFGPQAKASKAAKTALAASRARLAWLDGSLKVNGSEGVLLFTGCLSLFDAVARDSCGGDFGGMAKAAVKLLNKLGIAPLILEDERCCGRDLYDIGERDYFMALAQHNIGEIKKTGASQVLTICPECAFTLKKTYEAVGGDVPAEVRHIGEFLAGRLGELSFEKRKEKLVLHDPCYLCRYLDAGEAPRKLLAALSAGKPIELGRQGVSTACCGAGSWVNHGPHTRTAVNERLVEAHKCGAETLVTACPKCTLLYSEVNPGCSWKQAPVAVKDLVTLAASSLK